MFSKKSKLYRQSAFTDLNQAYENNNNNVSFGGTNTSNYYNNNDNATTAYVVNEDLYVEVSDKEQEFDNFDNNNNNNNKNNMFKRSSSDKYLDSETNNVEYRVGQVVGGTFAELRANVNTDDIEEELYLALEKGIEDDQNIYNSSNMKTKNVRRDKYKKRSEMTYVEVDVDDHNNRNNNRKVNFGKYMGSGIPLSPEVEFQLMGLMKKAGKYRLTIDRLEDRLKKEIDEKKKVKEELTSTTKELEVAKLVAGSAGNNDWRNIKSVGGSNINSRAQAAEARRKREEERRKLFSGLADDEEEGMLFGDEQSMHYIKRLIILAKRWWKKHQPFGRDLLMVESRYGNSVASYFIFFRWLFINAMILAVLQSLFLTSHIYSIYSSGLPYQQNGTLNATLFFLSVHYNVHYC